MFGEGVILSSMIEAGEKFIPKETGEQENESTFPLPQ